MGSVGSFVKSWLGTSVMLFGILMAMTWLGEKMQRASVSSRPVIWSETWTELESNSEMYPHRGRSVFFVETEQGKEDLEKDWLSGCHVDSPPCWNDMGVVFNHHFGASTWPEATSSVLRLGVQLVAIRTRQVEDFLVAIRTSKLEDFFVPTGYGVRDVSFILAPAVLLAYKRYASESSGPSGPSGQTCGAPVCGRKSALVVDVGEFTRRNMPSDQLFRYISDGVGDSVAVLREMGALFPDDDVRTVAAGDVNATVVQTLFERHGPALVRLVYRLGLFSRLQ